MATTPYGERNAKHAGGLLRNQNNPGSGIASYVGATAMVREVVLFLVGQC